MLMDFDLQEIEAELFYKIVCYYRHSIFAVCLRLTALAFCRFIVVFVYSCSLENLAPRVRRDELI